MMQSELPLYPKLSPIYNKIMQLAIAILLLVILLNTLIYVDNYNRSEINQYFKGLGQQVAENNAAALSLLFKQNDHKAMQNYIDSIHGSTHIHSVHFYDATGKLLFNTSAAKSINELYGIKVMKLDLSKNLIPFVHELRGDKLEGYVRVTLDKKSLTQALLIANDKTNEIYRILLAVAGVIGFLLTRGLNRFSRQGFRFAEQIKAQHQAINKA